LIGPGDPPDYSLVGSGLEPLECQAFRKRCAELVASFASQFDAHGSALTCPYAFRPRIVGLSVTWPSYASPAALGWNYQ